RATPLAPAQRAPETAVPPLGAQQLAAELAAPRAAAAQAEGQARLGVVVPAAVQARTVEAARAAEQGPADRAAAGALATTARHYLATAAARSRAPQSTASLRRKAASSPWLHGL